MRLPVSLPDSPATAHPIARCELKLTMHDELSEVEGRQIARRLQQDAKARQDLDRTPTPFRVAAIALVSVVQVIFPTLLTETFGLPVATGWFVAMTIMCLLYLLDEVTQLRRQIKALQHLCRRDDRTV